MAWRAWSGGASVAPRRPVAVSWLERCCDQDAAWRAIFDHYVFDTSNDPAAHIAKHRRGVLGKLTPELEKEIKTWLVRRIKGEFEK